MINGGPLSNKGWDHHWSKTLLPEIRSAIRRAGPILRGGMLQIFIVAGRFFPHSSHRIDDS
jgi:hypothetical protein